MITEVKYIKQKYDNSFSKKKMLKYKICWVFALALIDFSWVQALPSFTVLDKNAIYNRGKFEVLGCPENEFLNDEGKACEPTCEDPIRPDVCKEKKVITCECDDGYVRNATGACIRPEKCLHQLPPKSENTLSESGSKHSGVIIEVFEPRAIESYGNDTVNEATMSEGEADDREDLENTDARRSELEDDPGLLEFLSNVQNEYHKQHMIEHQPEPVTEEFDNIDYSNDVDNMIDLSNWVPVIYK